MCNNMRSFYAIKVAVLVLMAVSCLGVFNGCANPEDSMMTTGSMSVGSKFKQGSAILSGQAIGCPTAKRALCEEKTRRLVDASEKIILSAAHEARKLFKDYYYRGNITQEEYEIKVQPYIKIIGDESDKVVQAYANDKYRNPNKHVKRRK